MENHEHTKYLMHGYYTVYYHIQYLNCYFICNTLASRNTFIGSWRAPMAETSKLCVANFEISS